MKHHFRLVLTLFALVSTWANADTNYTLSVTAGRPDTYRSSLREHDTRAITHDLAWIDELIDATRVELDDPAGPEPHRNGDTQP